MDNLEQTLREILTPEKVAAYLDVKDALSAANNCEMNFGEIMLDLGTIIRDCQLPGEQVCESCCFERIYWRNCFVSCACGEIFHLSEEVRKNLHPQTATSLKNLCQRKESL